MLFWLATAYLQALTIAAAREGKGIAAIGRRSRPDRLSPLTCIYPIDLVIRSLRAPT